MKTSLTILSLTLALLLTTCTAQAEDSLTADRASISILSIGQLCLLPIPLPCTPLPRPPHGQHFIVHGVIPWQTVTGTLPHPFRRVPLVTISAEGALNGKALASVRFADLVIMGWAVTNTSDQVQDIHVIVRFWRPLPLMR